MKTINRILLSLLLLLGYSCQEEYTIKKDVVQEYVTTSFGNQQCVMQVNGWMSFIDLSRGVVSRVWTFPNDVAIGLDSTKIVTSSSENLKVSFIIPGVHKIHLKQKFCKEIETEDGIKDEKEQYIEVTVLDSLEASFIGKCRETEKEIALGSEAKNLVQEGHHIDFTVTSKGSPDKNTFTFIGENGKVETIEAVNGEASYQFYTPGLYSVTLESSNRFGQSSLTYTQFIKVVVTSDTI